MHVLSDRNSSFKVFLCAVFTSIELNRRIVFGRLFKGTPEVAQRIVLRP